MSNFFVINDFYIMDFLLHYGFYGFSIGLDLYKKTK